MNSFVNIVINKHNRCNLSKITYCYVQTKKQCSSFTINTVKKYDYDNYLCLLTLPEPQRRLGFAIRTFNVELALISFQSKNTEMTKLRYTFFREMIHNVFKKQNIHRAPLETELLETTQNFNLSKTWFMQLIESRESNHSNMPYSSQSEMESYFSKARSPVHYLLAESFGYKNIDIDNALSHLGIGQGYCDFLRSIHPLAKDLGLIQVPYSMMNEFNLNEELLLRLCSNKTIDNYDDQMDKLRKLSFKIADLAFGHIKLASDIALPLKRKYDHIHLLMLPIIPVLSYLKRLRVKSNFDFRNSSNSIRSAGLPLEISYFSKLKKIKTVKT